MYYFAPEWVERGGTVEVRMEYEAPAIEERQSVVALMTRGIHPHIHPNNGTHTSVSSAGSSPDAYEGTLH